VGFVQTVTPPPRAEQGAAQKPRVKLSSGVLEFARPDRFRFSYQKPFEQLIVADGQRLWLYDADLKQATERRQTQVLQSTPAALIIGASSLDALRTQFQLTNAPDADGLEWAQAVPKSGEGQIQRIRIGFRPGPQGSTLAALEFLDSFGQNSRLQFSDLKLNLPLGAERFSFRPPAGVSVVRQ
jgi:outer membrane lipoprotein carrier protein